MRNIFFWIACALLLLLFSEALAEMYQYVDDQGAIRFVESLSDVPKKHRRKATPVNDSGNLNSYTDNTPAWKPSKQDRKPVEEKPAFTGNVEIYLTSWCPACKAALKFMNQKGISYTSYDIEKDADASRRFSQFGGRGVPLIIVGEKRMRGFDAGMLEKWLGKNG